MHEEVIFDEYEGLAWGSILQVRYLTLFIIDELFMRSKLFRTLLVEKLDHLLTLSVGFRRNQPLPAPPAVASVLRAKAVEFLEKWNTTFGIHYRQLRLGYDYLKNTLRFQFPNLQANAARIQQERRERELRTKEILVKKFEMLKLNIAPIKAEIKSIIDEIGECLDIISSTDESMAFAPVDEEEVVEFRSSELWQIRLDSLKEADKVQENNENRVVFDALRELYKLLVTKHLVAVQESISVLIRVEVSDNRLRDSMLKEFIDMQKHLQSVKRKCEESGCTLPDSRNHDEEIIWEEDTTDSIESFENVRSGTPSKQSEGGPTRRTDTPEGSNKGSNDDEKVDCKSSGMNLDPLKSKLLAEAPVMKWGSFLDNWGSNRDVLANQRGLDLDGHWGRVDLDAVIPAEKIAELNVQATFYEEVAKEIPQCRAPLKKGGLCQRRDLKVCPFHGPVVARDDEGKPINENPKEEVDPYVGTISKEELMKQAVKNVRERDKEAVKKREYDKQELKRAKLAKVRGHNEAMLRDAAMASTSRSSAIVEAETTSWEARKKKDTLSNMLKKKVMAKDRLARRLLNTRAKESTTRQLNLGEDAKYREAFPNQW